MTKSLPSFGSITEGSTSAPQAVTVSNNQSVAISLAAVMGGTNPADFAIAPAPSGTMLCGTTLAANSTCGFTVVFSPSAAGARSATLMLSDSPDPNSPYAITLSGKGVVPVGIAPTSLSLSFSTKAGNTSGSKNVTVTNNQTVAISLAAGIGGANPAEFAIAASGTCGSTLAAKSSCTFAITFSPPAGSKGSTYNATLGITDSRDYPTDSHSIALTGNAS